MERSSRANRAALILFSVSALMPTVALANAGIGYFMIALPIVVVALIPAVPLEGLILCPILRVPMRRAMIIALRANIRSTLWGIALGVGADLLLISSGSAGPEPLKGFATFFLILFLFYTWWIEYRAVRRLAGEIPRRRRLLGTALANLASYAGMIAVVWLTPIYSEHSTLQARIEASEALNHAAVAKLAVSEAWAAGAGLADDADVIGYVPPTDVGFELSVGPDGRVTILFTDPRQPLLDGRTITLMPHAVEGMPLEWDCEAPEIERAALPSACRR